MAVRHCSRPSQEAEFDGQGLKKRLVQQWRVGAPPSISHASLIINPHDNPLSQEGGIQY